LKSWPLIERCEPPLTNRCVGNLPPVPVIQLQVDFKTREVVGKLVTKGRLESVPVPHPESEKAPVIDGGGQDFNRHIQIAVGSWCAVCVAAKDPNALDLRR